MEVEFFSYRNLIAYKTARSLVVDVYGLLKNFPNEERYALCEQLRRAVVSIPSNIAEGMGRSSVKEQVHFIEIAFASLNETMCQIEIAKDLGYIKEDELIEIENKVVNVAQLLSGLRRKRLDK